MAIDPQIAAGLNQNEIAKAVEIGQQMRAGPVDIAYKQAMIEQMGKSANLSTAKLQEDIRQANMKQKTDEARTQIEAQRANIAQQLANLEAQKFDASKPLDDANKQLIDQKILTLKSDLERLNMLSGVVDIMGNLYPAKALGPDNLTRLGVAGMVQDQKEDPRMAFERVYKIAMQASLPGDKQADAKARAQAMAYIEQIYGPEVAKMFGSVGGPKRSGSPLGW